MQATKRTIFFLFSFTWALGCFAQKQIEYKADKIKYDKYYKGGAKRLIGHVQFIQDGMVMTCDSSYFMDNNTIEAYSNIFIRKGDSLTITGANAKYDGNTKLGQIDGNVVCQEKDMTLTTTALLFDGKNSMVSYVTGGTIVSKENTLTSKHGYYHSPTKTVSFRYDVKLVSPEYTMVADTLKYVTTTKTAVFVGPTTITSKNDMLYCEQGWYNTQSQISHLTKNAVVYSGQNILHADSVHYDKKKETGDAFHNIQLVDNKEKVIIYGDRAYNNRKKGKTWVTGHALMAKFLKKDTLYACADTLLAIEKKIVFGGARLGSDTDTGKMYKDSSVVKALHHVKIFKPDVQGIADTLIYSAYDSTVQLLHLPVLWNLNNQLTGNKIILYMANDKIDRINIPENTFIVEEADSLHYNQVKGKELWAYFNKDTLKRIDITGNAQAVYFLKNDKTKKIQGANTIESSNLRILTKGEKLNQVTFIKSPKANIIPAKDINTQELELKGFSWQIKRKPTGKEDLLR